VHGATNGRLIDLQQAAVDHFLRVGLCLDDGMIHSLLAWAFVGQAA